MVVLSAGVLAASIFALEFAREQVWSPVIVSWLIAFVPVFLSLAFCRLLGGSSLLRAELFPLLFFFVAAPWPPRFEQPTTIGLMQIVAGATAGLLRLLGFSANVAGGAILLPTGAVGITEACSGIRSLQTGVMFGLAMGEWFLLRPWRRLFLLAVAVILAVITNLARTFTLSIQAALHGIASVDHIHDFIGTVMVTALVVAIFACARSLRGDAPAFSLAGLRARLAAISFPPAVVRFAGSMLLAGAFAVAAAHLVIARLESGVLTQTAPNFVLDPNSNWRRVQLPRDVWRELNPTRGDYWRAKFDRGVADAFHFFWEPSARNRFVLVHRPDVCMPGVGWQLRGQPSTVTVRLSGRSTGLNVFRFAREKLDALELWGVWRNGKPLPIDYQPDQVLGTASALNLHLLGKRQSATEIIACTVISDQGPPPLETATDLLESVFHYQPPTAVPVPAKSDP